MDTRPDPLPWLLVAVLAAGCGDNQPDPTPTEPQQSSGEAAQPNGPVATEAGPSADPEPGVQVLSPSTPDKATNAEPELSFRLLDQVRSIDLIDPYLAFPDALIRLNGQRVRFTGFMAPFDSLDDMRHCMIVPSYVGCTFCSPPDLTQVVYVTQGREDASSGTFPFIESLSEVSGVLRLSFPHSEHDGKLQGFIYSLEEAVVTPKGGDVPARPPGHTSTPHEVVTDDLEAVDMEELVAQVAAIVGREPLRPITLEPVSAEAFAAAIRAEVESAFPAATLKARAQAFHLLGLLPVGDEWTDSMTTFQLSRRVAAVDAEGERVRVLESVSGVHPYTRLDVVGEISKALMLQHSRAEEPSAEAAVTDDRRRVHEALLEGLRTMVLRRYATARGVPNGPPLPPQIEPVIASVDFGRWQATPRFCGYFFVRALIGDAGPLSDLAAVFEEPPATTLELFRPRWYRETDSWIPDPVPANFADALEPAPPTLTDVLGVGGLVPFLTQWYSLDEAMALVGGWTGDRWAVWSAPDAPAKLVLEVRWKDEEGALAFRDAIPDGAPWTLTEHEAGATSVRLTSTPR